MPQALNAAPPMKPLAAHRRTARVPVVSLLVRLSAIVALAASSHAQ
jgi:hypothetical protein